MQPGAVSAFAEASALVVLVLEYAEDLLKNLIRRRLLRMAERPLFCRLLKDLDSLIAACFVARAGSLE